VAKKTRNKQRTRIWPETIDIPASRRSCPGGNFLWHAGEGASHWFRNEAMSPSPSVVTFPLTHLPLLTPSSCSCASDGHTQASR
jgi:hypothetical protein